jgi:DNA-directed RNA polymerase subunit RPC12/RpoP
MTVSGKVFDQGVLGLFGQEGAMRTSREPRRFKADGKRDRDEVKCSECGTKLARLKDHIQKEDSFVCASCYRIMVSADRAVGMEAFE